jgi:hypothetical protein
MVVAMIALGAAMAGVANGGIGSKAAPSATAGPFITGAHVLPDSLTGANINESTLGVVPSATHAATADQATHATSADSATNANTVGGYGANSIIRVARGFGNATLTAGAAAIASVSITVPTKGFVLVQGYLTANGGSGCPCQANMYVRDSLTGATSNWYDGATVQTDLRYQTTSNSEVFSATPGVHSYSVWAWQGSGTSLSSYGTITAVFIPWGSTGSPTVLSNPSSPGQGSARIVQKP